MKSADNKIKRPIIFISFMIVMIVLGTSDSLRGIFALMFQEHFKLTTFQVSLIITVSYLGNLIFLLLGGSYIDRSSKKKAFLMILSIWMCGALLFVLSNNFAVLLIGMFLCMGASTLLNTTINILVPAVFASSPGFVVNVLFFIQGIGTSGSQNVSGRLKVDYTLWKHANSLLIILAVLGLVCLLNTKLPEAAKVDQNKISYFKVMEAPAFLFLTLIFGFYFIAEHGILNWLIVYSRKELNMTAATGSMYLSAFFGGITLGRLIFAPVVHKLGSAKSIAIFGSIGTVLYVSGIVLGSHAYFLLSLSGLSLSIVYPTLVLLVQSFYDKDRIATATGAIISFATVFDIGFNALFGKMVDYIGLQHAFLILPVSMVLFCAIYLAFLRSVKPSVTFRR